MFKVCAPLRIDLCGGVTDISDFSSVTGTCITNLAIDLYPDESYKTKRQIFVEFNQSQDKKVVNDFPISTGLGASAALVVETITGLYKLTSDISNENLITYAEVILKEAYYYEVEELKIAGGFQDYISAFFGGLNLITFPSINDLNLKLHKQYLGLQPELEISKYLNENMLVVVLKKDTKSSAIVVADQINNFKQNRNSFISYLNGLKKCNENVFKLLMNKGNLEQRLIKVGLMMSKSWVLQKKLSNFLGQGLTGELESKLIPFVYGLRCPGSGVNSLFLILKPGQKTEVLKIIEEYRDLVSVFYARVNTSGLQIII